MIIKRKIDALHLLEEFKNIASFDNENYKYYFVFNDKDRGGHYTIMQKEEIWSIHGKGEDYCDISETMMNDVDELIDFVWKHRAKINQSLKDLQKEAVNA